MPEDRLWAHCSASSNKPELQTLKRRAGMKRVVAVAVAIAIATGCAGVKNVVGKVSGRSDECQRIAVWHSWAGEAHGPGGTDYWMAMRYGGWDMDEVGDLVWECSKEWPEDWTKGVQIGRQAWRQERYGGAQALKDLGW